MPLRTVYMVVRGLLERNTRKKSPSYIPLGGALLEKTLGGEVIEARELIQRERQDNI